MPLCLSLCAVEEELGNATKFLEAEEQGRKSEERPHMPHISSRLKIFPTLTTNFIEQALAKHLTASKMPGSTSKAENDLATLKATVSSISTLLAQLQSTPAPTKPKSSNNEPPSTSTGSQTSTIDPLSLAHDSASLIKAHTTKISLLLISPPFTPTALTSILRALSTGALPGLASSIELCLPSTHTQLLSAELHFRATRLFSCLSALVAAIPLDGSVLEKEKKEGGRGSLVGTGAVWEACDEVIGLKALGVAGLCVKKVKSWMELLKDALEELSEWGEEEGSDDDEEEDDNNEDVAEADAEGKGGNSSTAQDIVDNLFDSPKPIPRSDPDRIRPRLDTAIRRLRLVDLLYTALIKRRFKTLPPTLDGSIIASIDTVLSHLKKIPDMVDELASAFYDLDPEEIDARMRECFETGKKAADGMQRDWKGGEDQFTAWVGPLIFLRTRILAAELCGLRRVIWANFWNRLRSLRVLWTRVGNERGVLGQYRKEFIYHGSHNHR